MWPPVTSGCRVGVEMQLNGTWWDLGLTLSPPTGCCAVVAFSYHVFPVCFVSSCAPTLPRHVSFLCVHLFLICFPVFPPALVPYSADSYPVVSALVCHMVPAFCLSTPAYWPTLLSSACFETRMLLFWIVLVFFWMNCLPVLSGLPCWLTPASFWTTFLDHYQVCLNSFLFPVAYWEILCFLQP